MSRSQRENVEALAQMLREAQQDATPEAFLSPYFGHAVAEKLIERGVSVPVIAGARHLEDSVRPIEQPAAEDLRNVLQALAGWLGNSHEGETDWGGNDIAHARDLVRSALAKLGEPTYVTIRRTVDLLRFAREGIRDQMLAGTPIKEDIGKMERTARDAAAIILRAQMEGR